MKITCGQKPPSCDSFPNTPAAQPYPYPPDAPNAPNVHPPDPQTTAEQSTRDHHILLRPRGRQLFCRVCWMSCSWQKQQRHLLHLLRIGLGQYNPPAWPHFTDARESEPNCHLELRDRCEASIYDIRYYAVYINPRPPRGILRLR